MFRSNPLQTTRWFYGWIMLMVLSWGQFVSWGVLYFTFPVFIAPMHQELGWPQANITIAFSIALLCTGLAGIIIGRILDRHGPRLVMNSSYPSFLQASTVNPHESVSTAVPVKRHTTFCFQSQFRTLIPYDTEFTSKK